MTGIFACGIFNGIFASGTFVHPCHYFPLTFHLWHLISRMTFGSPIVFLRTQFCSLDISIKEELHHRLTWNFIIPNNEGEPSMGILTKSRKGRTLWRFANCHLQTGCLTSQFILLQWLWCHTSTVPYGFVLKSFWSLYNFAQMCDIFPHINWYIER